MVDIMVVDGKENLHPNSSQQNELTNFDTNAIKPFGSLIEQPSPSIIGAQRPLLFSEILFGDINEKQFGISCTGSNTVSTNTLR